MIVMKNNISDLEKDEAPLILLGVGIIKVFYIDLKSKFEILFQKGIGLPLIQNLMELYINDILLKKQGNSILPANDFTIFMHYFQNKDDIIVILLMDEKKNSLSYPKIYNLTKEIRNSFRLNNFLFEIKNNFNDKVLIPKSEDVIAIFILGISGIPYITKVSQTKTSMGKLESYIGGFISAISSFSKEIIGIDSGAELKEINFGNQLIYMITKEKVIFAFLVEKLNSLTKRYMYLIVDEFLESFNNDIINFDGNICRFNDFENRINQYFIL